jgi:hypothetical protein
MRYSKPRNPDPDSKLYWKCFVLIRIKLILGLWFWILFVCFRSVLWIRLFGTGPVFCLLLYKGTITSVFKDKKLKIKGKKSRFFLLFLLVDKRILIQEPQKHTDSRDPNPGLDPQHCFQHGSGIRFWKILGWRFGRELAGALWRRFFLSAGENEESQVKGESEKKIIK